MIIEACTIISASVIGIGIYCLIIYIHFGHQSYWKYFLSRLIKNVWLKIKFNQTKEVKPTQYFKLIYLIDDSVLIEIFSYLDSFDSLKLSETCVRFKNTVNHIEYWRNMHIRAFDSQFIQDFHVNRKVDFFRYLRLYPLYYISSHQPNNHFNQVNNVTVIIHNSLYDITQFISDHPGGTSILIESAGMDCSKRFDLGYHSPYALQLSLQYLIWSPNLWFRKNQTH